MQATGSLAVPVLKYSFEIFNWYQEEILDRKTRKMPTVHGQHHPRLDIDWLCVPRKEGGRGLMQVEGAYIAEALNSVEYVEIKEDPLTQIVRTHQHNTKSALLQTANKFKKSFQIETKQMKNIITQKIEGKWEEKRMHRQFPRSLDEKLVDKEQSYRWLKFGDVKGETESTIVTAQDQAVSTNYFMRKVLKEEIEVYADCVKNTKKLLTIQHQDVPFWQRINI
jgi:hypothetical protein